MGDKDKVKALRNENEQLKRQLDASFISNLSKHDFKRKIKSVLFDILSLEDSYLNIRNVIQKDKFS